MRRTKKVQIKHNYEFELDLAPLLAVMVKLVPVLLISSAFMQVMIIETELPQVVREAIQQQNEKPSAQIQLYVNAADGLKITISENGNEKTEAIPIKDGNLDFSSLHEKLLEIKKSYPSIFKIELFPSENVAYKDIIKIMDEARRSGNGIRFPVFDKNLNKDVETDYMFPEVVFANTMEG